MKQSKILLQLALAVVLLLNGLALSAKGTNQRQSSQVKSYSLGGSTTVDKLMQLAIEKYTLLTPNVQVSYEGVGSSNGVKNVLNNSYLLGGSSRNLKEAEKQAGAKGLAIAYDGIALVVNNGSDLSDLDLVTAAKIFSGELRQWQEVDPSLSGEITVVTREAGSGTYASFKELVMGKDDFRGDALVGISNGDVAAKVAATAGSIGYIGVGYVDQISGRAHMLSIADILPTPASIADGSYPISRSLYLVYRDQLDGFKKEFSDFLLSDEGQQAVLESGFIPLK